MSPPVIDAVAEDPNEARAFRVGLVVIAKRVLLALAGLAFVGGLSAAMISRMGGAPPAQLAAPAPPPAPAAPVAPAPLPAPAAPVTQFVPPPIATPPKKATPKKQQPKKVAAKKGKPSNSKPIRRPTERVTADMRRKIFQE